MQPKTEEFLHFLLWSADKLTRPTFRNLTDSYESWAYRNGLLRQSATLEKKGLLEPDSNSLDQRLYRLTEQGRIHVLGGRDPAARWARAWDGKWRLVLFDLPSGQASRRERLWRYEQNKTNNQNQSRRTAPERKERQKMKSSTTKQQRQPARAGLRLTAQAALLGLLALGTTNLSAGGNQANPGILPPQSDLYGKSYAEWSAKWWEWFMEFPVQDKYGNPLPHPTFDDPNFDVRDHQDGDVWFLAETQPITIRTCDIPHGKFLFVALHTAEASNLEGLGNTEAEQRETAQWFADHIVGSFFEIDGHPVAGIESYRVASPQFKFKAPTPWVFGATGGKGTSVGDGYYVMLEPLPRGQHTIHYGGSFHFSIAEGDPFDLELPQDTTYHLNVK